LQGNFEFGDVATQRMLAGVPTGREVEGNRTWNLIVGDGTAGDDANLAGKSVNIGVSPLTVDVALSVGIPPRLAIEARGGVNPSGLRAALLRVGAKPGTVAGHAGLLLGAQGSLHPNLFQNISGFDVAVSLGQYDRTVLGQDLVVAGKYSAPVADLLGGSGATFASNAVMVATVDCLGDVIAAFGEHVHGTEVAVGVLRPPSAAARPTEEICAVPAGSAPSADAQAASLRQSLNAKTTTVASSLPFVAVLSRSTVSEGTAGSTRYARATLYDRPNAPAGESIQAFNMNTVPKMLGI
jgi:hypothetical protein